MSKFSKITLIMLLIFQISALSFASQTSAEMLNRLQIVSGVKSDNGKVDYKLNNALTRAEAAVLIYKLSGGTLAQIDIKKTPEAFKDVKRSHWAFKYIAYCSDKGILSGMPGGVFKPESPLSEKAFLAMLLKLQGYSANDFTWDTVYETAYDANLVSDILYTVNPEDDLQYKRGQAFDTLYTALQQKNKSTGLTLLGSMVGKGVISYDLAVSTGLLKKDGMATSISSVEVGQNSLTVNFNETIKDVFVGNVNLSNAGISQSIKSVNLIGGKKLIITTDLLIPKAKYTIQVANVEDMDGNVASRLSADVTIPSVESASVVDGPFRITNIKVVGNKIMVVEFNRNVSTKALQELLYTVVRPSGAPIEGGFRTISVASTPQKNAIVMTLKNDILAPDQQYTLKIKGDLTSVFGEYLNEGNGDSLAFAATDTNKYEPVVEKSYVMDSQYMRVLFNTKLSDDISTQWTNYQLLDTTTNRYVGINEIKYLKDDSGKALYSFKTDGIEAGRTYVLTIKTLKGQYGEEYRKDATYTIKPERLVLDTLALSEFKVLDAQTIRLRFNRAVWQDSTPSIAIDRLGIYKVLSDPNDASSYTIYLYSPMVSGQNYTLRFTSYVMDIYGTTYGIKNYDFVGMGGVVTKLDIIKATMYADNRIVMTLNRDVDASRMTALGRVELTYTYNGNISKLVCDSIEAINSKVIMLKFSTPFVTNQGYYDLRVGGLIDYYNNSNDVYFRVQ